MTGSINKTGMTGSIDQTGMAHNKPA